MDRVGFLIEETGERIGCMLNPETLEIGRIAGISARQSSAGRLTLRSLRDDPLLLTGGGSTELRMELLFDIGLAGAGMQATDVRQLTGPLWQLAENRPDQGGLGRLNLIRFVWGKAWNIPGVISEIAERFEDFTADGMPRRSWIRMRFLRVESISPRAPVAPIQRAAPSPVPRHMSPLARSAVTAGASSAPQQAAPGMRLDAIAMQAFGNPSEWRRVARYNNITDPFRPPVGRPLMIPPKETQQSA